VRITAGNFAPAPGFKCHGGLLDRARFELGRPNAETWFAIRNRDNSPIRRACSSSARADRAGLAIAALAPERSGISEIEGRTATATDLPGIATAARTKRERPRPRAQAIRTLVTPGMPTIRAIVVSRLAGHVGHGCSPCGVGVVGVCGLAGVRLEAGKGRLGANLEAGNETGVKGR